MDLLVWGTHKSSDEEIFSSNNQIAPPVEDRFEGIPLLSPLGIVQAGIYSVASASLSAQN